MTTPKAIWLANHEIVTLAVYLLGGETQRVDTEDIAIKANSLAPGRFTWRKHLDQINIENVRTFLSDAKKPKNGRYLAGAGKEGWILTGAGMVFAKQHLTVLKGADLSRKATSAKERNWQRRERERMLASDAFAKFTTGKQDAISACEAESFFRVDAYVIGGPREEKILRTKNAFGDDSELGPLINLLESKITKGGSQ